MSNDSGGILTVAIVGGGLAGIAAAAALTERKCEVILLEARSQLGGRAGSFSLSPQQSKANQPSDDNEVSTIDHCQHVGMGCCTHLTHLCAQAGLTQKVRRDRVIHFFNHAGKRSDFKASSWLPAPFHLGPAFMRLNTLTPRQRLRTARLVFKLARKREEACRGQTVLNWLSKVKESAPAIDRFWSVVLVSALGETLEQASLAAARKVFVDGFLSHHRGYELEIPTVTLSELYDIGLGGYLRRSGVRIELSAAVKSMDEVGDRIQLQLAERAESKRLIEADACILATPWRHAAELVANIPRLKDAADQWSRIESAPITAVHLWFDKELSSLPHAVFTDRLSHWVFARKTQGSTDHLYYYQIVISASRDLRGREHESIVKECVADLATIFPKTLSAKLLRSQVVTQQEAVFSLTPEFAAKRPSQKTAMPNLFVAGDWTDTGWPATMEGAVRSGRLAANALLQRWGMPEVPLTPDLPRNAIVRALIPG